jgi:DNA (cytosine-5)-methyltransferase 1
MPRIKYGKGQGDVLTRLDALVFPCLRANGGGLMRGLGLLIPEATKQGYAIAKEGDSINLSQPNSKTRRGRVGGGMANTLDTQMQQHTIQGARIRRLTEVECERLQGFPDGWTEGVSSSQRYKALGNAVTVDVVCEIAKRLKEVL